jgi:malate dehydrogenase (quinone)
MGFDEKLDAMREYYPDAQADDWELVEAGQRVQVIKKDEHGEGALEFGTELIHTKDGSLAGLLGASPGASTAVSIMLNLLAKCFPQQMASVAWQEKLIAMMPGFGKNLNEHAVLLNNIRQHTKNILQA